MIEPVWQRPLIRRRRIQFNQAFKLTLRAACLRGGPTFGEDRAMRRPGISPAVQLNAGVGRHDLPRCEGS